MDGEEETYGGCEEHALTSGTMKVMLSGPGQLAENETNEVNFREIPSHMLLKVCMYFTYKVCYTKSSMEIPQFPTTPKITLKLLMPGNFLDC
uniref:Elongin-C n=1 Tax=Chinchilla lanigera TaxID=34839 RepID=A0A8C2YTJ5_CHILA